MHNYKDVKAETIEICDTGHPKTDSEHISQCPLFIVCLLFDVCPLYFAK